MNTSFPDRDLLLTAKDIPAGETIHIIIRSVARSGMSRRMSFFYITKLGALVNITWHVGLLLNEKVKDGEINVTGCGMDMAYFMVTRISRVLHQQDYALKSQII